MVKTLAIVLVVSQLSLASSARVDEAEDKAVAFVERLGGKVSRNDKAPGRPVVEASLLFSKLDLMDDVVKELTPLKNLTALDLGGTKVTDVWVKELRQELPRCSITK